MPRRERIREISHKVGLDIGSHRIKGVEIIERGSEIVIQSAGSVAIPSSEANRGAANTASVVQAIQNLWASAEFETDKVVMGLPPEVTYIKWLHLEKSGEDELDGIARAAAARGAPFPAEDAVIDYRILSSRGAGSHEVHFVMLVAASSSAVDGLLDTAERAGLAPVAVDIGTVAAVRSFETQKGAAPLWSGQPRAHCVIGAKGTTIAVVRGGALEFVRTVPFGGNDFTQCIAEAAEVDWAVADRMKTSPDAKLTEDGVMVTSHNNAEIRIPCGNLLSRLAREMVRSLRFFSSQFAEASYLGMIGTATLSGGGALLRGIDTALQQRGIEVRSVINPFAGFPVDADGCGIRRVEDSAAAYTTAVGLATGDYWGRGIGAREAEIAA